jgi:hypothetical protein
MRLIFEAFTEERDITIGDCEIIQGLLFSGRFATETPLGVIRMAGQWNRFLIAHAYVDEDPPTAMLQYAENRVDNMILAMPSGKLLACGYHVFPAAWREEAQEIPRGIYRVSGFALKPGWREETQSAEQHELLQQFGRYRRLPSMAFFFGLLTALSGIGWTTLHTYRTPLGWLFTIAAFLLVLSLLRLFSSDYIQIAKRGRAIEREFPAVVLVLERQPDEPALKLADGTDATPALPLSESNP